MSTSCNPAPDTDIAASCSRTVMNCSHTVATCIDLDEQLSTNFSSVLAVKFGILAKIGRVHRRLPSRKNQVSSWTEPFFEQLLV